MSAFIVSQKTINQVLTFLNGHLDRGCGPGYAFRQLGFVLDDPDSLQKLGQELFDLNCLAVDTRYAHNAEALRTFAEQKEVFHFRFEECLPIQAYKSLQCLYYQCSEARATDTKLYKALSRVEHEVADYLLTELVCKAEYDKAQWGAQ